MTFRFHIPQYLTRRAADWKARGFTETLTDVAALNARSKFWGDDGRAAFRNWEEVTDPRNPLGGRQGVNERIMLRELLRRVDMMVMLENRLDALVRLHTPLPPAKIGGADEPGIVATICAPESLYGPNAGLTEVLIPAGYVTTAYDPVFKLSDDRTRYMSAVRHADQHPGAGPAVLARVPRRARQRGRAPADRLGLRSRVAAPRSAAGVRAPLDRRSSVGADGAHLSLRNEARAPADALRVNALLECHGRQPRDHVLTAKLNNCRIGKTSKDPTKICKSGLGVSLMSGRLNWRTLDPGPSPSASSSATNVLCWLPRPNRSPLTTGFAGKPPHYAAPAEVRNSPFLARLSLKPPDCADLVRFS